MNNQKAATKMLERHGIGYKIISPYILKIKNPLIEIRTYDNDYDVAHYPQAFFYRIDNKRFSPWFYEFYCKSTKDLENNILFLIKML